MPEPMLTKVHEDARGEMYAIVLPSGKEILLIHSKAGALRGGHHHTYGERVLMLEGEAHYSRMLGLAKLSEHIGEGDARSTPAGQLHMAEFPVDTWLIEMKLGMPDGTWKTEDHEPWRKRVRASANGG